MKKAESERIWKEAVTVVLRYNPGNWSEGLKGKIKYLSQNSWCFS
jgi:hypothetical protein